MDDMSRTAGRVLALASAAGLAAVSPALTLCDNCQALVTGNRITHFHLQVSNELVFCDPTIAMGNF